MKKNILDASAKSPFALMASHHGCSITHLLINELSSLLILELILLCQYILPLMTNFSEHLTNLDLAIFWLHRLSLLLSEVAVPIKLKTESRVSRRVWLKPVLDLILLSRMKIVLNVLFSLLILEISLLWVLPFFLSLFLSLIDVIADLSDRLGEVVLFRHCILQGVFEIWILVLVDVLK